uniref:TSA: Wollemia nobilis Ref_Wollemi_Transcript_1629_832 transcribed RNA sequence n=1 Tax=Wollemia nobilis TaxID=56998 RepID=A0A0C9S984_9CONI
MGGCMTKGGHIKVLKTDGNLIRVEPPLYAKDIMCDYPNHGIFDAASVTRLGLVLARPLPFHAKLRPSRLYYLVPLPFNNNYNGNNMSDAMAKIQHLSSSFRLGEVSTVSSTMAEEDSDNEGALRVKLRMRKEDAERFISECQAQSQQDLDFVESVVTPLLMKQDNTSHGGHGSASCSSCSTSSGWKPALDTIEELNSDAESIRSSTA